MEKEMNSFNLVISGVIVKLRGKYVKGERK